MKKIDALFYLLASALGALIFYTDAVILAKNDDGAKFTLMFLVFSGFIMGSLQPKNAWRWSLAIGLWLPILYTAAKAFGFVPVGPSSYAQLLIFIPIGLIPTAVGSYAGALLRKFVLPP